MMFTAFLLAAVLSVSQAVSTFPECAVGEVPAVIDFENLAIGSVLDTMPMMDLCFTMGITAEPDEVDQKYDATFCIDIAARKGFASEDSDFIEDEFLQIFDGTCGGGTSSDCSGNDGDLFFPEQKNILILGDGDTNDPDDQVAGGVIQFVFFGSETTHFSRAFQHVKVVSVTALDFDSKKQGTSGRIKVTTTDGSEEVFETTQVADGASQVVPVGTSPARSLEVELVSSGAIGDIQLCLKKRELCTSGELDSQGVICCADTCQACGGCDCATFDGGAEGCCPETIFNSDEYCIFPEDTGCIACCPGEECLFVKTGGSCPQPL